MAPQDASADVVRYTRPELLHLSRSPKVAKAGQLLLAPADDAGQGECRMPRFKDWFGDLSPPSPPAARPSPHSPPTSRARTTRLDASGNPLPARERDRPPHVGAGSSGAAAGGGGGLKDGALGGMGSFRHASSRGEKRGAGRDRGERDLERERREDGEEKGGLRKMAESFDRGERVPKSWNARATDATGRDDKDSADKDDSNWGNGDWRSRAANLPTKPSLSTNLSSSSTPSSSNGQRESRTAPGRPAWNPAPTLGDRDPRSERGERGGRDRRRADPAINDEDETPAWMQTDSPGDGGLEKTASCKGRSRIEHQEASASNGVSGGGGLLGLRGAKKDVGSEVGGGTRDGEDAIMRFKREMREREGVVPPSSSDNTSAATTPAADKPAFTGMFDHLSPRVAPPTPVAPLLPPSSAALPSSGLFRDPAILASPALSTASPVVVPAATTGGGKRVPGGSRFAKFFENEPKKPAVGGALQLPASPGPQGQAINLMSVLAGGGAGAPPPPPQQQQQQRAPEENNQMNKLLAMLQNSQLPPPQQPHLDIGALSLGGPSGSRPPPGIPAHLAQQQQRSRPASPAYMQPQQQGELSLPSTGRYSTGHDVYGGPEPPRRQERDHLQALLEQQQHQQRATNVSPLAGSGSTGGGGYTVDQLRQLQQLGGSGGRMGPPQQQQQQQQQQMFRQQNISLPPSSLGGGGGGLPPPNAAEIQNQLLRQMMLGGPGGGAPNGGGGGRGGLPNGAGGGSYPPMPPPPPQQRQERYLDQLLASHQQPLGGGPPPPPQLSQQKQQPFIDQSILPNPRQQHYIDSLRQQQYAGMGQPQPPQGPYGGGGYGGGPGGGGGMPPQQDLMALLRGSGGVNGLSRP